MGGEGLSQDAVVLCLFVSHGLELDQVESVAFVLRILQLLHQMMVTIVGLLRLYVLLELLLRHRGGCGRLITIFVISARFLIVGGGCGSLEVFLAASLHDGLQEARIDLLLVFADATRDYRLVLFLLDAQFEIKIELLLGCVDDWVLLW